MPETVKKHTIRWIVLAVCLILVLGAALVCIWQRNNIKALWLMATVDEQSLAERQEEQAKSRQEILDKYEIGEISEYEFPEQDGGLDIQAFLEGAGQTGNGTGTVETTEVETTEMAETAEADTGSETGNGQVIQQCVAALYALESQYMSKLDTIIEETKSEYRALPKEERTRSSKLALVKSKMSVLLTAESQCDSEVELLLQRIQQELDSQGDTSELVSEIRQEYEESKATWKASCLTALYK